MTRPAVMPPEVRDEIISIRAGMVILKREFKNPATSLTPRDFFLAASHLHNRSQVLFGPFLSMKPIPLGQEPEVLPPWFVPVAELHSDVLRDANTLMNEACARRHG